VPADGGVSVELGVTVLPAAPSLAPATDGGGRLAVVDGVGRETWRETTLVVFTVL